MGWLDETVKRRALRIINDGSDLQRWIDETTELEVNERRAVLEKLKEQLLSPQPEPLNKSQIERLELDEEIGNIPPETWSLKHILSAI